MLDAYSAPSPGLPQWEAKGHSSPQFIDGMAIDPSVAQSDVEGELIVDLPDRAGEPGHCFSHAPFALVKNFGDGAHRPIPGTLEDCSEKRIRMVRASDSHCGVDVRRQPSPAI